MQHHTLYLPFWKEVKHTYIYQAGRLAGIRICHRRVRVYTLPGR